MANLPFLGCDGFAADRSSLGQATVASRQIAKPTTAGLAVEILARALARGMQPPELTLSAPTSPTGNSGCRS
jgi:hypothetical protein